MDTNTHTLTKDIARILFEEWIKQRPGLDPRDYGDSWNAYRTDANNISKDRKRALTAWRSAFYAWTPFDADLLLKVCQSSFSGRLSIEYKDGKGWYINYCTGQYWPTEYRHAAAVVLEAYNRALDRIYYPPS